MEEEEEANDSDDRETYTIEEGVYAAASRAAVGARARARHVPRSATASASDVPQRTSANRSQTSTSATAAAQKRRSNRSSTATARGKVYSFLITCTSLKLCIKYNHVAIRIYKNLFK